MHLWTATQAKAKFDKVLDAAKGGMPQIITRNGKRIAVVVAIAEWERKPQRIGNLVEFFAASPLRGADIAVSRAPDKSRLHEI